MAQTVQCGDSRGSTALDSLTRQEVGHACGDAGERGKWTWIRAALVVALNSYGELYAFRESTQIGRKDNERRVGSSKA